MLINSQIDDWCIPFTFRKLDKELNKLYFEKYRMRFLTNGIRIPIANIVWYTFYCDENFKKNYITFERLQLRRNLSIDSSFKKELLRLKLELEKEKYELKIISEDERKIIITVL